jgi:hypothetical protein
MVETHNLRDQSSNTLFATPEICLLLTATIDPEGMIFTERSNPKVRLEDYKKGLVFWLQVKGISKIVFCENSNYDLSELHEVEKTHNHQKKEVEFLSFYGQDFPKHLGKGYGELKIISHAVASSKIINHETKLIKATGRYIVNNIDEFIDFTKANPNSDIICDLSRGLKWSDSRLFACSMNFIEQYLSSTQEQIDDSKGINFEKALAIAVHRAMGENQLWLMPPCLPEVSGIFGTTNTVYKRFFVKDFLRKVVYKLKRFFFYLSN